MKSHKTTALFFFLLTIISCKKNDTKNPECATPAIYPYEPYTTPVWHPNGNLVGFNHSPLAGVSANGTEPCEWYMNSIKSDSTGFYIMNKDGTGLKRITDYNVYDPSWSPDGRWLAFMQNAQIYKMRFTGTGFDTAHIIRLPTNGASFFPVWTANSDTIYFDSNMGTNGQGYYVWKMASDGSGQVGFPNTGRAPFVGNDNNVYYIGLGGEVFSMYKDGSNKMQVTFSGNGNRRSPKYYQNKIYFLDGGIYATSLTNYAPLKICNGGSGVDDPPYDISINGEIVYETFEFGIKDKRFGTLWIINADGTNNRQLTFNNF